MNDTTLTLIDLLVKGTAVLLLGFGCIAMLRHSSAAHRSLAWLAAFVVMLALPLAAPVKPVWTVPVHVVSKQNVMTPKPAAPAPFIRTNELPPVIAPIHPPTPWTLWHWLAGVYAIGACSVIGFRLLGSWQLLRLRRNASAADAEIVALVQQLSPDHPILILESSDISVPMTWGTFKPLLLLPTSVHQWSTADLRAALEHELAHIRHRDAARRWLGTLVTALWWPHPLVWLASRAWKLEQERACDDAVLRAGSDAESYASQLIAAAHSIRLGSFQSAAVLVMAMPSGLETRLRSVVSAGVDRSRAGRVALVVTCASALLLAVVTAICQAQSVKSDQQMIYITSKFVEITANPWKSESPDVPTELVGGKSIVLNNPEFQKLIRTLNQRKGVDLMSAPSVTTKPGTRATVEVVRDFVYPTALEADGITPAKFETKGVGIMCSVDPSIVDGGIRLEIEPMVREFKGFGLPSQPGRVLNAEQSSKEVKKGELPKALFYERAWKGSTTLKPGQCFVQELTQTPASDSFVTATSESGDTTTIEVRQATTSTDSSTTIRPLGRRVWFFAQAELVSAAPSVKDSPAKAAISGPTFTIFGHVARQGKYPLKKDATLKDAVQSAGGLRDFGDEMSIRIERKQGDKKEVIVLDLAKDGGTPLQASDAVIVPEIKDLPPLLTRAKSLRLPNVIFQQATLPEAVDYLQAKSRELDPDKQGINILVKEDAGKTAKLTLDLRDVPLHEALRYVTELSNTHVTYSADAVVIDAGPGEDLSTRVYRLPINELSTTAKDWLVEKKVNFPEGAAAVFDPKTRQLTVKNTNAELQKVEDLMVKLRAVMPNPKTQTK